MTTFTVWKFDTSDGADAAVSILEHAESEGIVKVLDHAVVSWPLGQSRPKTKHVHEATRRGTGWGAFWGLLLGTIFFMPVLGAAAGAAIGAVSKATEGVGIRKEDVETIRNEITAGSSALFVVTEDSDLDRLGERFHGMHSKLVDSNLTGPERRLLLETFGGE